MIGKDVAELALTAKSFSHYAYAASIAAAIVLAIALPRLRGWPRIVLSVWLILVSVHGLQVANKLRQMGSVQATLLNGIDRMLRDAPGQKIVVRAQIPGRNLSSFARYRTSQVIEAFPGTRESRHCRATGPVRRTSCKRAAN